MTLNQFVVAFRKHVQARGIHPQLGENREIRIGEDCPLSWMAKTFPCSVASSAEVLGLTPANAWRIANAADFGRGKLRRQLLKAAGIK